MLEWIKTRGAAAHGEDKAEAHARKRHGCNKAGKYQLLYEYLETRYANTVVLTFGQVEDLLGFSLPDLARIDQEWWTIAVPKPAVQMHGHWPAERPGRI